MYQYSWRANRPTDQPDDEVCLVIGTCLDDVPDLVIARSDMLLIRPPLQIAGNTPLYYNSVADFGVPADMPVPDSVRDLLNLTLAWVFDILYG